MESNQIENQSDSNSSDIGIETEFVSKVTPFLENLYYPSESDEPIEWIQFKVNVASPLTVSDLEFFMGLPPETSVQEIEPENFWQPVTTIEDWYGEEEKQQVAQFESLKALLETHIQAPMQAFKVGQIEIDVYLVGPMSEKEWGGLKTKVVET